MTAEWEPIALGEAFATATGNTPPKRNAEFYGDFIPLVKPPELRDSTLFTADDALSESGAAVARTLPPKSILVSCIGNLGKIGLNTVPVAFNQQINAILPDESKALPEFMFFQALSPQFKERLESLASGTTVPIVNKSKFNSIDVVLPPLPEQQRIVGILDKAFEGIATAKANAEKNVENAREVFESHLEAVFSERGKRWRKRPLAELCESSRGITYGVIKLGDEVPNGVPCLRTSNVRWLRIETDGMKRIAPKLSAEYSRTVLKGGEVLVNVRGTLGGVAVASSEMAGWNVSREVAVVPIDPTQIDPEFVSYLIGAETSQQWLGAVKKGAAYVGINLEDLRLLPVGTPSVAEQQSVVVQLKSLNDESLRLESVHEQKAAALDDLKKSLLHQAFSGQL